MVFRISILINFLVTYCSEPATVRHGFWVVDLVTLRLTCSKTAFTNTHWREPATNLYGRIAPQISHTHCLKLGHLTMLFSLREFSLTGTNPLLIHMGLLYHICTGGGWDTLRHRSLLQRGFSFTGANPLLIHMGFPCAHAHAEAWASDDPVLSEVLFVKYHRVLSS
jgi:hypothetical protein